jgi:hypothetical protein
LSHDNPRWEEFEWRLFLALGCANDIWVCPGDMSQVESVLIDMGMAVATSLEFLGSIGCRCDCEVLFQPAAE